MLANSSKHHSTGELTTAKYNSFTPRLPIRCMTLMMNWQLRTDIQLSSDNSTNPVYDDQANGALSSNFTEWSTICSSPLVKTSQPRIVSRLLSAAENSTIPSTDELATATCLYIHSPAANSTYHVNDELSTANC